MMRALAVLFGVFCLFFQRTSAQDRATSTEAAKESVFIEGHIVNALTGEPVRNANLTLMLIPSGGGTVGAGPPKNVGAVSDVAGKFKFENLEPGRYSLSAEKTGYVRQQYGARPGQPSPGTPLTGAPGETIKDLEFKLTPQAVISGKVLNEDGEPLSRVSVQVLRQTAYFRRSMGMTGTATNDVGQFLIGNLVPGKYIIRADYNSRIFGPAVPLQASDENGVETYVATFYPSATDPDEAVPVAVNAGQEVSGIEIWLRKSRAYRVRGKVLGMPTPDNSTRIQVSLDPQKPAAGRMMGFGGPVLKPDGNFEFPSVQPGSYFLNASVFSNKGGGPQPVARVPVTVANGDVDGIIIQAAAPARMELSGRVAVEGDENNNITNGSVLLQLAEGYAYNVGAQPARIQNDGTFKIAAVFPGKYYIMVMGLPEGPT